MAQLSNQDDFIKTAFRLPRDLHAAIQKSATNSGRSMNAEIIALLEATFSDSRREAAIEDIKSLLDEQYRKAFEEAVIASLERYKIELLNQTKTGKK